MAKINFKNIVKNGFDEDALTTATVGDHVLNFGALITFGDKANGIFAEANNVSVANFGSIETFGSGAAGIYVEGADARIVNHGSVVTHGAWLDPIPEGEGDEFFSEGLFANGDRFYIANHGTIRVEGEISSAMVGAGEDGLAINFGVVESTATVAAVIAAFGDRSQAINLGQVTSSGESTGGMVVNGEDASALNLGNILVTGAASNGMAGDEHSHLTNRGVIHFTLDDTLGNPSFGMISIVGGSQLSNFGLIEMHGTFALGISALGRIPLGELGSNFEIVNAGRITTDGDLAIGVALGVGRFGLANAEDGQIENRGVIETVGDGATGVLIIGDNHHLTNSGRITTDGGEIDGPLGLFRAAGVAVSGDGSLVENTRTGVIESKNADSAAIELNVLARDGLSDAGTSSTLENFGLIKGAYDAVLGRDGQETVVNHGRIVGNVVLGDGVDTFVFGKGGTLSGNLFLGGGNDLVVVEDGSGKSRIAEFEAGQGSDDRIDLSAFHFDDLDDLIAHTHNSGTDVVIDLDRNDQLVLSNVQLLGLHADDFLFG